MTPSLPTFSMASAMSSPMVSSLLAETVPTWAISVRLLTALALLADIANDGFDSFVNAPLQLHRPGAGSHVLETFSEDGLCQHRRRRRAVAGHI